MLNFGWELLSMKIKCKQCDDIIENKVINKIYGVLVKVQVFLMVIFYTKIKIGTKLDYSRLTKNI